MQLVIIHKFDKRNEIDSYGLYIERVELSIEREREREREGEKERERKRERKRERVTERKRL